MQTELEKMADANLLLMDEVKKTVGSYAHLHRRAADLTSKANGLLLEARSLIWPRSEGERRLHKLLNDNNFSGGSKILVMVEGQPWIFEVSEDEWQLSITPLDVTTVVNF